LALSTKIDWNANDYFNPEELNRIEENIVETLDLLKFMNDNATIGSVVDDRDYTSIDYVASYNRIENNIKKLKDYFYEPLGWIPPKINWVAHEGFSYIDANRMEIDIKLLYELIQKAKANVQFCGMFYCGSTSRINK
jgi:hypothetical protein